MQDIKIMHVARGTALPGSMKPIFDEASETIARLPDLRARSQRLTALDRARNGPCGAVIFMDGDAPAGLICYDTYGDDAQMFFGHVLHPYDKADTFRAAIDELKKRFRVLRSNFNWPEPEEFSSAARAMGFVVVERLSMTCAADPGHMARPLPDGLRVVAYSPAYFEAVSRLMCETSDPMDRVVNPLFTSVEGCRALLRQMLDGIYGRFVPELAYVALDGSRLAGYLITASYADGVVHIDDIAVGGAFRGKGLASAMIDRLIHDSGAMGNKSVELAVTTSNTEALRLYRHKGFAVAETFRQHIYVRGN